MIGKKEYKSSEAERERKRRYYQANRAALLAKSTAYKQAHPEKVRQYTARYRDRWRLELRIKAAGYYLRQGVAILRRARQRYAAGAALTYRRLST